MIGDRTGNQTGQERGKRKGSKQGKQDTQETTLVVDKYTCIRTISNKICYCLAYYVITQRS